MLKVYGHIYSDAQEKFDEIVKILKDNGYQIAYDSDTNATIIKEVVEETDNEE